MANKRHKPEEIVTKLRQVAWNGKFDRALSLVRAFANPGGRDTMLFEIAKAVSDSAKRHTLNPI
jgi:hypothetical protein